MKIYFVRHGESEANLQWVFSNRTEAHPLTERGWQQAHSLAERLVDKPISRIYTSPVLRARQTAEVLARELGLEAMVCEALRELDVGIYEGTSDPAGWTLHRQVMEDWLFHDRPDSKMPGGENFIEIIARFVPFIDQLLASEKSPQEEVVLVSHGGLLICMLPVVLADVSFAEAYRAGMSNTAYVLAETRKDGLYRVEGFGK